MGLLRCWCIPTVVHVVFVVSYEAQKPYIVPVFHTDMYTDPGAYKPKLKMDQQLNSLFYGNVLSYVMDIAYRYFCLISLISCQRIIIE